MSLYKDPRENRDYFRVKVCPGKSAYLVVDPTGGRIEVTNVSAGGFAFSPQGQGLADLPPAAGISEGYLHQGTLYLSMDDAEGEVRVPLVFRVIDVAGLVRCEIVHVEQSGKDSLYTYVWETDQDRRHGRC